MAGKNITVWTPTGDLVITAALLAQIMGESSGGLVSTPITTAGAGVLTAAALVGGQIARTGPVAAYSDATDTAAAIIAAFEPNAVVGSTFEVLIKNATAFPQTITGGTGVTMSAVALVPPMSIVNYFVTVTAATTVSFTHRFTAPIANVEGAAVTTSTALATVGAGVVLAAGIVGGVVARSGAQSFTAFADTTDTATAIIAAQPGMIGKIGTTQTFTYVNNTNAPVTIGGGTGVTVSGITVVPANSWADYLITYTAADTLTMVGLKQGFFPARGTYINNGVSAVTVADAHVTADSIISFTLKTVGGTVSASAPNVKTITPGTGFTVAGLALDTSTYNYEIRG